MNYLVQIDGTEPKNWCTVQACNPEAAIIKAITPLIEGGRKPERAYVALGESKHANGTPLCVQSYRLHLTRTEAAA